MIMMMYLSELDGHKGWKWWGYWEEKQEEYYNYFQINIQVSTKYIHMNWENKQKKKKNEFFKKNIFLKWNCFQFFISLYYICSTYLSESILSFSFLIIHKSVSL